MMGEGSWKVNVRMCLESSQPVLPPCKLLLKTWVKMEEQGGAPERPEMAVNLR